MDTQLLRAEPGEPQSQCSSLTACASQEQGTHPRGPGSEEGQGFRAIFPVASAFPDFVEQAPHCALPIPSQVQKGAALLGINLSLLTQKNLPKLTQSFWILVIGQGPVLIALAHFRDITQPMNKGITFSILRVSYKSEKIRGDVQTRDSRSSEGTSLPSVE